ncbi:MAG: DegV family protein [Anaerolineae bacterium]|nr:DegV family protein [Anaerolineae bacterium]
MIRIKIVVDSVADIPQELRQKWDIGLIPTYVNYGGQSYADDGIELDRTAFYNAMPTMTEFPTTSAPALALAEDILRESLQGYDHIVAIHVPEKYSTTINVTRIAAQQLPPDSITIIDGHSLTAGLGLLGLMAAEKASETGDVQQVVDLVERVRDQIIIYAAIATMTYIRRSGRVNNVVAAVGSLLQIKPLLHVHSGEIGVLHRIRTFGRTVDKIKELVHEHTPLERLIVLHIQNEEGAQQLKADLQPLMDRDVPIMEVGPTLGTLVGPGSLGVLILPRID